MAKCTRRYGKCGRAALLAAVLAVGVLLIGEHYQRLDTLIPADRGGDVAVQQVRGDASRTQAVEGPPKPQYAERETAKANTSSLASSSSKPEATNPVILTVAPAIAAAPTELREEEPPEPADGAALRLGLAAWLSRVATFQEVETIYILHQWFQHASVKEVATGITHLLKEDGSAPWTTCAVEDEICKCSSRKIRYGHVERRWLHKEGVQDLLCSLGTFGGNDVAVGMLKQCQCFQPLDDTAGVQDLKDAAGSLKKSMIGGIWSALRAAFLPALDEAKPLGIPATANTGRTGSDAPTEPAGFLWHRAQHMAEWVQSAATYRQLRVLAKVYKWLENTRSTAKISVAIAEAAAPAIAKRAQPCPDGKPLNAQRCPGNGEYTCRAGCDRGNRWTGKGRIGGPGPRMELCAKGVSMELLWSCDGKAARLPIPGHHHSELQYVMDKATEAMCASERLSSQLEVFLDCEFLSSYLQWTTEESEWIEEAYVTYVSGRKDSTYEWQATNLVRSVDVFSSRPIIVVVFGEVFVPPASWLGMPNLIVYRMKDGINLVSFNFNKIRSMIAARVACGIQLDTDQLIAPGMDQVFHATRREITAKYPWPMMPVHWMSREGNRGEPYWEYAFRGWSGHRSMRWGHAHPTWSYWALPFLCDMLHERLLASIQLHGETKVKVWNLPEAEKRGLTEILENNMRVDRVVRRDGFMGEDEDMLNVALWRDSARKDWCKFDLEWGLFKERYSVDLNLYWDLKWYPKGMPVVYISMHNTKQFEITDWLVTLLARCDKERPRLSCPYGKEAPKFCTDGSSDERRWRAKPSEYTAKLCCCFEPRQDKKIYWAGQWWAKGNEVPMKVPAVDKPRTCVLP